MTTLGIGSDHGGYDLKNQVIEFLKKEGYTVKDYGTHSKESCDYPLIGFEVAKAVAEGAVERGILICKSGIGMTIIANKVSGVRAAACYDTQLAALSREHNDCNVLVLSALYSDASHAGQIAKTWLTTEHAGDRHQRRVQQIHDIEKKAKRG